MLDHRFQVFFSDYGSLPLFKGLISKLLKACWNRYYYYTSRTIDNRLLLAAVNISGKNQVFKLIETIGDVHSICKLAMGQSISEFSNPSAINDPILLPFLLIITAFNRTMDSH